MYTADSMERFSGLIGSSGWQTTFENPCCKKSRGADFRSKHHPSARLSFYVLRRDVDCTQHFKVILVGLVWAGRPGGNGPALNVDELQHRSVSVSDHDFIHVSQVHN